MAAKKEDMKGFWESGDDRESRRARLVQEVEDKPATKKTKRINVDIEINKHSRFRAWASKHGGGDMKAVLNEFIEQALRGEHNDRFPLREGYEESESDYTR